MFSLADRKLIYFVAKEYTDEETAVRLGMPISRVKWTLSKMFKQHRVKGKVGLIRNFMEYELTKTEDARREEKAS